MAEAAADPPPAPTLTARQPRAIHSALTVLEAVAALGAGVTAREISATLGLPRATTYRLLNLLVQDEFLVRTPDLAGFALGAKVVQLAVVAAPVRLPTAARDVLAQTRSQVRGGVHVVVFSGGRLSVVDADPDFPLSDGVRLAREPERFALGRLMLVSDDPGTARRATTEPRAHMLAAAADDLRRHGATRQMGEVLPGFGCLAVPIRDAQGSVAGAVGFSGPQHRVEHPQAVVRLLRPAADLLSPLLT
ncbi:IclR family transcriptional regulator [Microbacterium sp. P03]|uniref:IclR family transcriptional regulator n=1 Tax=Microbacterium sp. P03 TaxID=3366946 RepID=UPI00374553D9